MPKWLHGIFAPTLMLWLYAMAFAVASAFSSDGRLPDRADHIAQITLPFILASWVIADAQKRRRQLCYDYDSFVFLASPIVVPVYLFRTRGARAFITLLCFAGIWLVAMLLGGAVSILREYLLS
jgi:hypothetical protein